MRKTIAVASIGSALTMAPASDRQGPFGMTPISGEERTTNTEAPQQGLDPPDGTSRNAESTDPLKEPSPAWVFGPDVEFPEAGKREPSFAKGYLATLLVILTLIELHVWLATNGYGGLETMLAKLIFE